jgi:hypothetical protein
MLLLGACAANIRAQAAPSRRSAEGRVDAVTGTTPSTLVSFMLHVPAGPYVRMGAGAGAGATWRGGGTQGAGRADFLIRGLLDPYRETPRGLSIGGGVSVSNVRDGRWRPYVTLAVDIEGRRRGSWVPALQFGLGGGARVGLAIRTAQPRSR